MASGWSRRTLLSEGFTRALNAIDGFFAGMADALTASISTRLRSAMWGDAATRNHEGGWFTAGQIVGQLISLPLMAANPCSMGAIAGTALRVINGLQLVGNGISAVENIMAGNYLSAGLNVLGMVGNLTAMSRACFTGDMEVITRRGWVRWDALTEHDEILSRNEFDPTGELAYKPIDLLMQTEACIWHVRVAGKNIRTTSEHPFYVVGRGWIAAHDLQIGDMLCTDDGRHLSVESVQNTGVVETVYNCSVADYHTYFVGRSSWGWAVWAHNRGCSDHASILRRTLTAAGQTAKKYAAHLVPSGEWLKKSKEMIQKVRELHKVLNEAGIGLNHAANGLFTNSRRHLGTHTYEFIRYVHKAITPLAGDRGAIITKLREIAELLKKGKLKF